MQKMTRKKSRPQHREEVNTEPVSEGYNYKMLWNSMETDRTSTNQPSPSDLAEGSPPVVISGDESTNEGPSVDSLVPTFSFALETDIQSAVGEHGNFNCVQPSPGNEPIPISQLPFPFSEPSIEHIEPTFDLVGCSESAEEVIQNLNTSTFLTNRLQPVSSELSFEYLVPTSDAVVLSEPIEFSQIPDISLTSTLLPNFEQPVAAVCEPAIVPDAPTAAPIVCTTPAKVTQTQRSDAVDFSESIEFSQTPDTELTSTLLPNHEQPVAAVSEPALVPDDTTAAPIVSTVPAKVARTSTPPLLPTNISSETSFHYLSTTPIVSAEPADVHESPKTTQSALTTDSSFTPETATFTDTIDQNSFELAKLAHTADSTVNQDQNSLVSHPQLETTLENQISLESSTTNFTDLSKKFLANELPHFNQPDIQMIATVNSKTAVNAEPHYLLELSNIKKEKCESSTHSLQSNAKNPDVGDFNFGGDNFNFSSGPHSNNLNAPGQDVPFTNSTSAKTPPPRGASTAVESLQKCVVKPFPTKKNFVPSKVKLERKDVVKSSELLVRDLKKMCDFWVSRQIIRIEPEKSTLQIEKIDYSRYGTKLCSVSSYQLPEWIVAQGTLSTTDERFKTWESGVNRLLDEERFRHLKVWRRGRILLWRECQLSGMSWSTYKEEVAFIEKYRVNQMKTSPAGRSHGDNLIKGPQVKIHTAPLIPSPDELLPGHSKTPQASQIPLKRGRGKKRQSSTSRSNDGRSSREISPFSEEYVVERSTVNDDNNATASSSNSNTLKITLRKASVNKSEDEREKTVDNEEGSSPFSSPKKLSQLRGKRKIATKRTYRKPEILPNVESSHADRIKTRKVSSVPVAEPPEDQSQLGCRSHEVENFNLDEHWQIPFEQPTLFRSPREASRLAQLKNKKALTKKVYNRQPKVSKDNPATKDIKALVEMLCTKTVEAILCPDSSITLQSTRQNIKADKKLQNTRTEPSVTIAENALQNATSEESDSSFSQAVSTQDTTAEEPDSIILNAPLETRTEQSTVEASSPPSKDEDSSSLVQPAEDQKEKVPRRSRRRNRLGRYVKRPVRVQGSEEITSPKPSTQVHVVSEGPGQETLLNSEASPAKDYGTMRFNEEEHGLSPNRDVDLQVSNVTSVVQPVVESLQSSTNIGTIPNQSKASENNGDASQRVSRESAQREDQISTDCRELFNTQVHEISEGPGDSEIEVEENKTRLNVSNSRFWKKQHELVQDSPASPPPVHTDNVVVNMRVTRSKKRRNADSAYIALEKNSTAQEFSPRKTRSKQDKSEPNKKMNRISNSSNGVLAEVEGLLGSGCKLDNLEDCNLENAAADALCQRGSDDKQNETVLKVVDSHIPNDNNVNVLPGVKGSLGGGCIDDMKNRVINNAQQQAPQDDEPNSTNCSLIKTTCFTNNEDFYESDDDAGDTSGELVVDEDAIEDINDISSQVLKILNKLKEHDGNNSDALEDESSLKKLKLPGPLKENSTTAEEISRDENSTPAKKIPSDQNSTALEETSRNDNNVSELASDPGIAESLEGSPVRSRKNHIDERTGLPTTLIQKLRDPRIRSKLLSHLDDDEDEKVQKKKMKSTFGNSRNPPADSAGSTLSTIEYPCCEEPNLTDVDATLQVSNLETSESAKNSTPTPVVTPSVPEVSSVEVDTSIVPETLSDESEESIKPVPKKAKKSIDEELMYKSPLEDLQQEARPSYGRAPRYPSSDQPLRNAPRVTKWSSWRARERPVAPAIRSLSSSNQEYAKSLNEVVPFPPWTPMPTQENLPARRNDPFSPEHRLTSSQRNQSNVIPALDEVVAFPPWAPKPTHENVPSRRNEPFSPEHRLTTYQRNQSNLIPGLEEVVPFPPWSPKPTHENLPTRRNDPFSPEHRLISSQQTQSSLSEPVPVPTWTPIPPQDINSFSPEHRLNAMESHLRQLAKRPRTTNINEPPVPKVYAFFDKNNPQIMPIPSPMFDSQEMTRTITMMDPMGQEMIDIVQLPRPTSGLTYAHLGLPKQLNFDDVWANPHIPLAHFVDAEVEFSSCGLDFLDLSDPDDNERSNITKESVKLAGYNFEQVKQDVVIVLDSPSSPTGSFDELDSSFSPRWSSPSESTPRYTNEETISRWSNNEASAPRDNSSNPPNRQSRDWVNRCTERRESRSKSPLFQRRHNDNSRTSSHTNPESRSFPTQSSYSEHSAQSRVYKSNPPNHHSYSNDSRFQRR